MKFIFAVNHARDWPPNIDRDLRPAETDAGEFRCPETRGGRNPDRLGSSATRVCRPFLLLSAIKDADLQSQRKLDILRNHRLHSSIGYRFIGMDRFARRMTSWRWPT